MRAPYGSRAGTCAFASTAESQAAGIATIYQEINLAQNRTVAENIFLAREPRRFGLVDRARMQAEARTVLSRFKLDIDVNRPLQDFGAATRQMVAIARGVTQNARLLILDEPTSSLDEQEVEGTVRNDADAQGRRRCRHLHQPPAG